MSSLDSRMSSLDSRLGDGTESSPADKSDAMSVHTFDSTSSPRSIEAAGAYLPMQLPTSPSRFDALKESSGLVATITGTHCVDKLWIYTVRTEYWQRLGDADRSLAPRQVQEREADSRMRILGHAEHRYSDFRALHLKLSPILAVRFLAPKRLFHDSASVRTERIAMLTIYLNEALRNAQMQGIPPPPALLSFLGIEGDIEAATSAAAPSPLRESSLVALHDQLRWLQNAEEEAEEDDEADDEAEASSSREPSRSVAEGEEEEEEGEEEFNAETGLALLAKHATEDADRAQELEYQLTEAMLKLQSATRMVKAQQEETLEAHAIGARRAIKSVMLQMMAHGESTCIGRCFYRWSQFVLEHDHALAIEKVHEERARADATLVEARASSDAFMQRLQRSVLLRMMAHSESAGIGLCFRRWSRFVAAVTETDHTLTIAAMQKKLAMADATLVEARRNGDALAQSLVKARSNNLCQWQLSTLNATNRIPAQRSSTRSMNVVIAMLVALVTSLVACFTACLIAGVPLPTQSSHVHHTVAPPPASPRPALVLSDIIEYSPTAVVADETSNSSVDGAANRSGGVHAEAPGECQQSEAKHAQRSTESSARKRISPRPKMQRRKCVLCLRYKLMRQFRAIAKLMEALIFEASLVSVKAPFFPWMPF